MPMMDETRDHPRHDPYLIASLVGDDLDATEIAHARHLVETCGRCAELFADLGAIRLATAQLPAATRTRDFRLSNEDAARLRSPWRRLLEGIGTPRFSFVQPLGAGLAALGVVGLLIAALPAGLAGGAASAPTGAEGPAPALGAAPAATAGPSVASDQSSIGKAGSSGESQAVPGPTSAPSAAPSAAASAAPATNPVAAAASAPAAPSAVTASSVAEPSASGGTAFAAASPGASTPAAPAASTVAGAAPSGVRNAGPVGSSGAGAGGTPESVAPGGEPSAVPLSRRPSPAGAGDTNSTLLTQSTPVSAELPWLPIASILALAGGVLLILSRQVATRARRR